MGRRTPPGLRRRKATRDPKKRFTIFCEGANTEPAYFAALRSVHSNALIEISTQAAAGVPDTIARKAIAYLKDKKKEHNSFEAGDEVWVVFDRDHHPKFQEAVNLCTQRSIGVARSDPCFELWLILHIEDFDEPDGKTGVMAHLRKLRPEYQPKKRKLLDYGGIMAGVRAAELRAEAQLARRTAEAKPYGRPSSTMGHLTRAIREAAEKFAS